MNQICRLYLLLAVIGDENSKENNHRSWCLHILFHQMDVQ